MDLTDNFNFENISVSIGLILVKPHEEWKLSKLIFN